MEFTRRLNALLMNLWGRKCFPRPTPPPSWRLPDLLFFNYVFCPFMISLLYFISLIILNRYVIFIVHFQIVLLISTLWSGSPVPCIF